MQNKYKIIQILCHSPNPIIFNYQNPEDFVSAGLCSFEYKKIDKFPFWVGFFRGDFHERNAKKIKLYCEKYEVEAWRPYLHIDQPYSMNIDGILHRVFPFTEKYFPGYGTWNWSKSLYSEILLEAEKNKILLHILDGHSRFITRFILKIKNLNIPILVTHCSGSFPSLNLKIKIWQIPINYFGYFRMKTAYKRADTYTTLAKPEIKIMTESVQHNDILTLMDGTDFNFFMPAKDKNKLRMELGLPLTKKIIIYVGRFEAAFGMDKILNWFNVFKTKNDSFELLLIGSNNETETHYNNAKESKAILIGRIPQELLLKYYQASDISLYPILDTELINSGGYGCSNIESSACGLPLISNSLIHFPGSLEERDKLGFLMPSIEDMERIILHIADNPHKYKECRRVAEKYFSEKNWINTLLNKYDELFRKYYEN